MTSMKKTNFVREVWLNDAVEELRGLFKEQGYTFGKVNISVGWPGGTRGNHSSSIGQAWESQVSSDSRNNIFISPAINNTEEVLSVIAHELCHVVNDCQDAHNKPFIDIAKKIGLMQPWTATKASKELKEQLGIIADKIGKYKGPKIDLEYSDKPKQTTRLVKVQCNICGYTCRTTRKWIDAYGTPICPKDDVEMDEQ